MQYATSFNALHLILAQMLFTPRTDTWSQHFQIQAGRIISLTPVGRTTVSVLNMNRPERVRVRLELEPETFLG